MSAFVSFVKKTAYALIGNVLALLLFGLAGHVPTGTPLDLQAFAAVAALLTGLVAAIKRLMERNPA